MARPRLQIDASKILDAEKQRYGVKSSMILEVNASVGYRGGQPWIDLTMID